MGYLCSTNVYIKYMKKEKWTRKEIKASMEQMEQFDTTKFFRLMENNPLRLVYWCEEQFEATLERKKHQSFCDDRIKQDVFSKYMTLQMASLS
ncbi:14304_t:CDS:2 [Entrophospora sp. SA101]|nr:14304_t:CDS:2 [Entrophospora sp. SA101]